MHVVVIGAGIAGLSAAVGLARHGIEVDVIEADSPQERTGAGISLLGNALRALGELNLADPCLDAGYGFDTIDIVDGDGNVMMSDRAPRTFRADRPGVVRHPPIDASLGARRRRGARRRPPLLRVHGHVHRAGRCGRGRHAFHWRTIAGRPRRRRRRHVLVDAHRGVRRRIRAGVRRPRRVADHLPATRTPPRPRTDAQPGGPGRRRDPAVGRIVLRLHSRERRRTSPDARRPASRVDGRPARRVQQHR